MNGRSDSSKDIVRDYDGLVKGVKFTLTLNGDEDEMLVKSQFLTYRPKTIPNQNRHALVAWFSLTAAGAPIAADIAALTFAAGTNIATIISGGVGGPGMFIAKLNADCQLSINVAPLASIEYYLNVVMPDGRIVTSPKIAITI